MLRTQGSAGAFIILAVLNDKLCLEISSIHLYCCCFHSGDIRFSPAADTNGGAAEDR